MSETLEGLAQDIKTALKSAPGIEGRKKVCERLSSALVDGGFIAASATAQYPYFDGDVHYAIAGSGATPKTFSNCIH